LKDIQWFRREIQSGRALFGPCISFLDSRVIDCLADSVDFFWIDMEHTGMTVETVSAHLVSARAHEVPAIVRVVGSGSHFIKPVLDTGAEGIIVPQVRSAEEVRQIVSDCRYPPQGRRGFGPLVPSNYGRDVSVEFIRRTNRQLYVCAQVENLEALSEIDDIVAVRGLDAIVLGPADLSASLGYPLQTRHPKVMAAMQTIISKARAAGLQVGAGLPDDPEMIAEMIQRGVQWMHTGGDGGYMWQHFEGVAAAARALAGGKKKRPARVGTPQQ
jgi:2-keto-3-deoxy-L-rhamnonate aldolase RhmA